MLDLLLPQRCVVCGCGGKQLCADCRDELQRIEPPLCARCGAPTAWPVERCRECAGRRLGFASARAAVGYDAAARRLVHAWKERGLRRLAAEAAQLVAERVPAPGVDALTFVPADHGRRLARGHNPAERLALALAAALGPPGPPGARGGRSRGAAVPAAARADARRPPARQLRHRAAVGARRVSCAKRG